LAFSQHWRCDPDFDHVYNNPATSGVDISPELLVRMFETIDNLTMVKGSAGDLSRMQRVD
jgi:4-hydroxy-tetrahydrodipicolinate synthase